MHKMDVKELLQSRRSTAEENQKLIQNNILPFGTKKREKRRLRPYRPFSQAIHCKNSNHADGDRESASQSAEWTGYFRRLVLCCFTPIKEINNKQERTNYETGFFSPCAARVFALPPSSSIHSILCAYLGLIIYSRNRADGLMVLVFAAARLELQLLVSLQIYFSPLSRPRQFISRPPSNGKL